MTASGTTESCDARVPCWTMGSAAASRAGSSALGVTGTEDAIVDLGAAPWAGTDVDRAAGTAGGALGVVFPEVDTGPSGSTVLGSVRSRNAMVSPGAHAGAWVAWTSQAARATGESSEPTALKTIASSGTRRRPALRSNGE